MCAPADDILCAMSHQRAMRVKALGDETAATPAQARNDTSRTAMGTTTHATKTRPDIYIYMVMEEDYADFSYVMSLTPKSV